MSLARAVGRWLVALLAVAVAPAADHPGGRPNFVIILADDLGYGDLSCYGGSSVQTPNLDRLATGGLRFTDFHSNGSVCSPTRAALLTGRYQQRSGVDGVIFADPAKNRHHGLDPGESTFPELLRSAGYATGCFGKWHLGYDRKFNPVHHGFDEFRGYVSGNVDYQSHLDGTGVFDWWEGDEIDRADQGYTTHLITRHAVGFIERHHDRPFCLYVPHEAPHYPYQGPGDPPLRIEGGEGNPDPAWDDREPEHMARAYTEMVSAMDDGVGAILDSLRRNGLEQKTLVFFFSDNGATGPGSNGALRGKKGSLWEGGHRVPAIAHWPGTVEAGRTTDQVALGMDVMPTLLDLAGVSIPGGHFLDGTSLRPVLLGRADLPERDHFWAYGRRRAVRRGPWKLVVDWRTGPDGVTAPTHELFNLADDPAESRDLSGSRPELVAGFRAALSEWEAGLPSR